VRPREVVGGHASAMRPHSRDCSPEASTLEQLSGDLIATSGRTIHVGQSRRFHRRSNLPVFPGSGRRHGRSACLKAPNATSDDGITTARDSMLTGARLTKLKQYPHAADEKHNTRNPCNQAA
jgi:hypothetical protein